jgi:hypothetical protein
VISLKEEITRATTTINVRYGSRITTGGLSARLMDFVRSLRAPIPNPKRVLRAHLCGY